MGQKTTLTDRWARSAAAVPAAGQRETFDDRAPRFGIRITAKGSRTYFATYRMAGKPWRYTIGDALALKADEARDEALRIHGLVKAGIDPNAERKRKEAEAAAARQAQGPLTIGALIDDYFSKRVRADNLRSADELRRVFDIHVIPAWGKRPAREIERADVVKLLDAIRAGGAPKQANRVLVSLKGMFGWALPRDHVLRDPCAGLRRPTKETPRDRILTDDELRLVWRASSALSPVRRGYIRFLIATGQRKQETARISRADIDAAGTSWLIPAALAKNGKAHSVPLSSLSCSILAELSDFGPGTAIFSTDGGEKPMSEFVRTLKRPLDKEMLRIAQEDAIALKRDPMAVKAIPAWVLHDLRRTAASGMARLAIAPHVIEKVLNHSPRDISGVAAVYNRHSYEAEKKVALDAWSRHVAVLVGEVAADNVVAFPVNA